MHSLDEIVWNSSKLLNFLRFFASLISKTLSRICKCFWDLSHSKNFVESIILYSNINFKQICYFWNLKLSLCFHSFFEFNDCPSKYFLLKEKKYIFQESHLISYWSLVIWPWFVACFFCWMKKLFFIQQKKLNQMRVLIWNFLRSAKKDLKKQVQNLFMGFVFSDYLWLSYVFSLFHHHTNLTT